MVEDQEAVQDATVKQVQERFLKWSEDLSDGRDGPVAVKAFLQPRYNFCVMIDQKCLDSLAAYEYRAAEAVAPGEDPFLLSRAVSHVFVILIRIDKPMSAWVSAGIAAEKASSRSASTTLADGSAQVQADDAWEGELLGDEDVGEELTEDEDEDGDWTYVETFLLMSMYESLRDTDSYWDDYVRPPRIYSQGEAK